MGKKIRIPVYQVDAFAAEPFRGNPAAVCIVPDDVDMREETMRAIAAEMNLSETAFVSGLGSEYDGEGMFNLRWFTPRVEVPLCGHATLATAAVLFREGYVGQNLIAFETKSGILRAERGTEGITLDFPADVAREFEAPPGLMEAMGISSPRSILLSPAGKKLLVHLKDSKLVKEIRPEFGKMLEAAGIDEIRGVIVTSEGNGEYDFVSRYFAPWVGIPEDPVTGSAHTVLGPYWADTLGKKKMRAYQASHRGGELVVEVEGERVFITGSAVIVLKGEIFI